MEAKKQSGLAKKYWKGISTEIEDKLLINSSLKGLEEADEAHFEQLKKFNKLSLGDDFGQSIMKQIEATQTGRTRRLIPSMIWKVAAAVAIGLCSYWLYQPMTTMEAPTQQLAALEDDPEKAFEVTKQALLLISSKLNKAAAVDLPLEKFEETRAKITEEGVK